MIPYMTITYKFNNGQGAVLCRECKVIIDTNIGYVDAVKRWDGRDVCEGCATEALAREHGWYQLNGAWIHPDGYAKRLPSLEALRSR